MDDNLSAYFRGEKLFGDDFNQAQLARWYQEESEGYSSLVIETKQEYAYVYHELNMIYGFSRARLPMDCVALGVGSASCDELLPILSHLKRIVSLDPSEHFSTDKLGDVPVSRVRPLIDGTMPFPDNQFDVITCFGVLHHLANVTFVLSECHRVLKPGGVMFLREPIVSMGDWRKSRRGATKNERGIPYQLLKGMIDRQGFRIVSLTLHDFTPLVRLFGKMRIPIFAHKWSSLLDHIFSEAFAFNKKYHRIDMLDKFGPASACLVLGKDDAAADASIV
jgi:SAM-dependent methyltransferase